MAYKDPVIIPNIEFSQPKEKVLEQVRKAGSEHGFTQKDFFDAYSADPDKFSMCRAHHYPPARVSPAPKQKDVGAQADFGARHEIHQKYLPITLENHLKVRFAQSYGAAGTVI
ncbi:hypothetical protein A1O1_08647 [Capronia coronata CBS 617.96]|uniref:Uncharacterized protein n=1 Tax=Capronia coronata CBS 617.96 TaxID=1182541 RepID=W9XJ13_9EURO|nr:uncharacterized protein A1O1_08647 [Capronia coronata CBS 617.96]EXJ80502.1 hypothetical protein A1O1_08647 [Capronia coronata CBS 617.96]